ncbi:hypothetical protein EGT50_07275 [Rhodococcus xishaensis]|uniref:Uncharacterized protein n=1 Tax=Rhodococcus xishaensis TaxID=2487364 RepID=A0A438AZY0_9NOCA|nr:hypothetical protein EGT50_07275 [Rhodococcus xishaensis]
MRANAGEHDRAAYIEDLILIAEDELRETDYVVHPSDIEESWDHLARAQVNAAIAHVEAVREQTVAIREQTEVIERAIREQTAAIREQTAAIYRTRNVVPSAAAGTSSYER